MKKESIFKEIREERNRQDRKWGEQKHKPIEWVALLTEEVGEVAKEAADCYFNNKKEEPITILKRYRDEVIQVAALAVSMIESLDKDYNFKELLNKQ